MHQPIPEQGRWLAQVVSGYFAYHAVPTNCPALSAFRHHVTRPLAAHAPAAQPEGSDSPGSGSTKLADDWLPKPRILHPWPSSASPSHTRGGSRMRELRPYGSVRGAVGNDRPYRERASRVHTGMRNSTRDEGGPFGFGDQEPIPSHCKLLRSKAVVVSVAVKVRTTVRPARSREASASEPLQKRRKRIRRCQNRGVTLPAG